MAIRIDWAAKEKLTADDLNTNFKNIVGSVPGQELYQWHETPTWNNPTPGQFYTAFPYEPGTLRVFLGREQEIKDVDYQETAIPSAAQPTQFSFLQGAGLTATDPNPVDDTLKIRVHYQRSDL
jgi:hypothetical protein